MTKDEAQIQAAVLKRLIRGEPVDPAALSGATGLAPAVVGAALTTLDSSGAFHLSDGTLVAAYPLSAVPTRHRLRIGRAVTYANCAVDALAVSSMADGRVDIESQCAHCGTAISIQMIGDRVLAVQPEALVVFHVASDSCDAGPSVLTRCPHTNFFCSEEHAERWRTAHPERRGDLLRLPEAVVRAREIFARVISLVGGAR